jgi:hypothetical protein
MLTSGMAALGAGSEGLIDDGLDGACATAAFGAAAEAAVDLLGIARKVIRRAYGMAHIMVAEDVAGTNNHETADSMGDAESSIFKTIAGCKRKK